ncbi:3'(2'),5'-bisphosphate nucleotidase CysQ [Caulobacter sp. NIBR1757]|uniref:3'(2'),5'-bisphosphate nucleotidase CysQ n=1 Tax=Caulobacter sp. NIBR1757 TaxID=3016000 RepID=UPI0022F09FF8|nr:3'(2'),5'-bisphosphate nucleotidase CysQ [Caulobacter sp. NIBR1757]WGM37876.1 Histidinol-phosphatase [Caulobacter sp. NIBR1757]
MNDLTLIREAAVAVGETALRMQSEGLRIWTKDNNTPVTDADIEVDSLLKAMLLRARPDYGWLSEETADDPSRMDRRRLFVVDPIDGTAAFMNYKPWWAVSIAVVEDGQPIAAVVHAPELEETFTARVGQGAHLNGDPIQASTTAELVNSGMLGDAKMFAHPAWRAPWPDMRIETRNSIAYRLCLVADGRFDAALALSAKSEWDLAAADLIRSEAGAVLTDHKGRTFSYNKPVPLMPSLICAAPAMHPLILERVEHIDLRN